MTLYRQELHRVISSLVARQEISNDHELTRQEHEFLVETLASFVVDASNKFILGSKHHGDNFLLGVNHLQELRVEIIDSMFYLAGATKKTA